MSTSRLRWALAAAAALALWLVWSPLARLNAVRPAGRASVEDRKRFGLTRVARRVRKLPQAGAQRAFTSFNRAQGGGWKIRFNPRTGAPEALTEGASTPRRGGHRASAKAFLEENRALTQVAPADLLLERQSFGKGMGHLLYKQTYQGLPVEFARVKVHVDDDGSVIGFNSSFEPDLAIGVTPSLSPAEAFASVRAELGAVPEVSGDLVVFPSEMSGRTHLAWKFSVRKDWRLWRYYVDAHTGQVLFRYDDIRSQVGCITSGTITAYIADLDPAQTPYAWRPMPNQRVWVKDGDHAADTNAQGFFCSDTKGKIATSLQGPYVNVANFRGASAHYDNGSGVWATVATPVSSPHPYPSNANTVETVNLAQVAPNAVKVLPVFSQFNVGGWAILDGIGDITDDDQVFILDATGYAVASYVGNRGPFNGGAVHGRRYSIRLKSNASGVQHGYDVQVSSYLTLSSPDEWNVKGSSLAWWPSSHTTLSPTRLGGEFSVFYQLNKMHDWFVSGVDKSSAAFLGSPLNANVYVGPDYLGANYNPDQDNLNFGDGSSASPSLGASDDATVGRHEYGHLVQERIFSSPYIGQSGAMQEAFSDYFTGSSLGVSSIGRYFNNILGNPEPLREMDCPTRTPCLALSATTWLAEVHDDSRFVSQAFWDMRKALVTAGKPTSCADGLVFEAWLFFPDSFAELYDALLRVDSRGAVAACGGANQAGAVIASAFAAHGLPSPKGDAWERNDGFMTAVDVSTLSPVTATLFPAGDVDVYSFSAGPGPIKIKLGLPAYGSFYKAYSMTLFDRRHREVAKARPSLDGPNTVDGAYCEAFDCNTTQSEVLLDHVSGEPNLYYLFVHGSDSLGFSYSGVNFGDPYTLALDYTKPGAAAASIVSASVDNDLISFQVNVTTFPNVQPISFAYARLRNHALEVVPETLAVPGGAATYLTWVSSRNAGGVVSGQVRIAANFGARFPAVGTVYLEIFGYNVVGSTISLGLSQALNLTTAATKLTTYNSVFNPLKGEKTTIKYEVTQPGRVTLRLFALNGTLVATLFDGFLSPGKNTLDWSGRNLSGMPVSSGVYILHLEGMGVSKSQKIVVVR